jgi:hypothetical protein
VKERIFNAVDDLKVLFVATVRFPGVGFYAGCGKYAGFKPSLDRYGLVINMGYVWIMFITYDFIASSANVMNEVMDKRKEIATLHKMYGNRTTSRRGFR